MGLDLRIKLRESTLTGHTHANVCNLSFMGLIENENARKHSQMLILNYLQVINCENIKRKRELELAEWISD